jgi:hypothetical protein
MWSGVHSILITPVSVASRRATGWTAGVGVSEWMNYDRRSVGQSVLVSSPIWGSRSDINYYLTVAVFIFFSMSGTPSDEKSGLSFSLTLDQKSQSHVTTDDQSVSKSWIRAPCGFRDRTLISVWHLRVLFYRLRAPPLTKVGSIICHSHYPSFVSKCIQIYM